jgi:hypothetical protein
MNFVRLSFITSSFTKNSVICFAHHAAAGAGDGNKSLQQLPSYSPEGALDCSNAIEARIPKTMSKNDDDGDDDDESDV